MDFYRNEFNQVQEVCGFESMAAQIVHALKVFLLTDCLINQTGEDISRYPHGSFADLAAFIEKI